MANKMAAGNAIHAHSRIIYEMYLCLKLVSNTVNQRIRLCCLLKYDAYSEQAISAREWALCQLTVCSEFQSRSE